MLSYEIRGISTNCPNSVKPHVDNNGEMHCAKNIIFSYLEGTRASANIGSIELFNA